MTRKALEELRAEGAEAGSVDAAALARRHAPVRRTSIRSLGPEASARWVDAWEDELSEVYGTGPQGPERSRP